MNVIFTKVLLVESSATYFSIACYQYTGATMSFPVLIIASVIIIDLSQNEE